MNDDITRGPVVFIDTKTGEKKAFMGVPLSGGISPKSVHRMGTESITSIIDAILGWFFQTNK